MIEDVWCIVRAVRVDGVVTVPPVVATAAQLSYDLTVNRNDGKFDIDDAAPVGNRPAGNILVNAVGWGFRGIFVAGVFQPDIPEHRNAVPCPAGGDT